MSDIFNLAKVYEYGSIHFKNCQKTGMQAIIAIHNTQLGPALGGCRFVAYDSTEDAIIDCLRLAQGMTYKAAMANLPLGGGKSVIIKPKTPFSREAYMESFGEFVTSLGGNYITAMDSGTDLSDMDIIATKTNYIASKTTDFGDPSPHTADGVLAGIKAAVQFKFNRDNLSGLHMSIQGLGHVGLSLAKSLLQEGVKLSVADINIENCQILKERADIKIVPVTEIHKVHCDVFIPCALGGILTPESISELNTHIIAGAANNQLIDNEAAYEVERRNILFTPDFVLNSGGLIFAAGKYLKQTDATIEAHIQGIYDELLDVFTKAQQHQLPPSIYVTRLAREKVGLPNNA